MSDCADLFFAGMLLGGLIAVFAFAFCSALWMFIQGNAPLIENRDHSQEDI